jgi:ribosome maturation factor RimP
MKEQERIQELAENQLAGSAYFVVDTQVKGVKAVPKVTVILDGDQGIGIDACAEISRKLDKKIEEEDLFPKGYVLEVSSPGIDQPLKLVRQYPKHVGRQMRIQLRDGSIKTGKLDAVNELHIVIQEEITNKANKKKKEISPATIAVSDIDQAFVLVSFA